jgi:hypothetical protein
MNKPCDDHQVVVTSVDVEWNGRKNRLLRGGFQAEYEP